MLVASEHRHPLRAGKFLGTTLVFSLLTASITDAEPPIVDDKTVIGTVTLDGGYFRPLQATETHSVAFSDGSTMELSFQDRAYHLSIKPELIAISLDGNVLGPTVPGYQNVEAVFSKTTSKTVRYINCKIDPQDTCSVIRVSFSAIRTRVEQAIVSGDDDLRCMLEIQKQPVSVTVKCREID